MLYKRKSLLMKILPTYLFHFGVVVLCTFYLVSCSKDSEIFNEVIEESIDEPIAEENPVEDENFEIRSFSFTPVNDVFLQNTNVVNNSIIRIEEDQRIGYLMFNLAPIDSIAGEILEVTLELTPYADQGNGVLNFHKGTDSTWDEDNIDLQDLPQKSALLSSIEGQYRIGTMVEADLQVAQIAPEELTIILEHTDGNDLAIASEEHPTTDNRPRLNVTYRVPRGAAEISVEEEVDPETDTTEPDMTEEEEEEEEEVEDTSTGTDADVLYWKELFDRAWATQYPVAVEQSESRNTRQEYYFMGYSLDGLTQVWQATGDNDYLNDALDLIENTIDDAVPVSGRLDGYLGWPSNLQRYGETRNQEGTNLWESFMYRYVATILRIMHDSPTLLSQRDYRNRYENILEFTKTHIWEKWYTGLDNFGGIYRSRVHTASHWARIGMELYQITGDQQYLEVFESITFAGMERYGGASIRDRIFNKGNAAVWYQTWDSNLIQDTNHGDDVVSFMVNTHDSGLYFTDDDMQALAATVNDLIWVTNAPLEFTSNVDGTGATNNRENGAHGVLTVARHNEALQNRIRQYYTVRTVNFREAQAMGIATLNRKYLNDGKPVYPENR